MSEQRDALAEALRTHRLHASMNICAGCEWRATPGAGSLTEQHEAHLAEILTRMLADAEQRGAARVASAVVAECQRFAQSADRYDHAEQWEYAGGLREAAHHIRVALAP